MLDAKSAHDLPFSLAAVTPVVSPECAGTTRFCCDRSPAPRGGCRGSGDADGAELQLVRQIDAEGTLEVVAAAGHGLVGVVPDGQLCGRCQVTTSVDGA